jgi:hypothetical protein
MPTKPLLHEICDDCEKSANRICAMDDAQLSECLACRDPKRTPAECTLRLQTVDIGIVIPSIDKRYHFKHGHEYRMSPTAFHNMLKVLQRVSRTRDEYFSVLGQLLIDEPGKWDIGALYVLRGKGIMKLVNIHQPEPDRTTLNFLTPGSGLNYWSSLDEVYQRATADDVGAHCEGLRRAGSNRGADQIEAWWKELNDANQVV